MPLKPRPSVISCSGCSGEPALARQGPQAFATGLVREQIAFP
jgi:hypothetical protein